MENDFKKSILFFSVEFISLGPKQQRLYDQHYRSSESDVNNLATSPDDDTLSTTPASEQDRYKSTHSGEFFMIYDGEKPLPHLIPNSFPSFDEDRSHDLLGLQSLPRKFTSAQRKIVFEQLKYHFTASNPTLMEPAIDFVIRENTPAIYLILQRKIPNTSSEDLNNQSLTSKYISTFYRITRILLRALNVCDYLNKTKEPNLFALVTMKTKPVDCCITTFSYLHYFTGNGHYFMNGHFRLIDSTSRSAAASTSSQTRQDDFRDNPSSTSTSIPPSQFSTLQRKVRDT